MSTAPTSRLSWFAVWQIPSGKYGLRRTMLLAAAAIMLSLITYIAIFRLCLIHAAYFSANPDTMTKEVWTQPHLVVPSFLPISLHEPVILIFEPAQQVDRWLRPEFWAKSSTTVIRTPEERAGLFSGFSAAEIEELESIMKHSLPQEPKDD